MAKRPEQTKKLEKYQVRVELEFSSRNPTDAREFHDALLVPNSFIDAKQGVKWSAAGGKYKAVFFLNDRTPYP
jgi:type IV pilus assembly protein PilM